MHAVFIIASFQWIYENAHVLLYIGTCTHSNEKHGPLISVINFDFKLISYFLFVYFSPLFSK